MRPLKLLRIVSVRLSLHYHCCDRRDEGNREEERVEMRRYEMRRLEEKRKETTSAKKRRMDRIVEE